MSLAGFVTAVSLAASGCALSMEAIAHHNSRGTACIESPAFAGIDLLIAGVTTAAVIESDASAGYFAVAGVFGASGLVGVISAVRCRGDDPEESGALPASNTAPSFGDAPVDPEARPATQEEVYGTETPPPQAAPKVPLFKNGIPTVVMPPPPPPPAPPSTDPAPTNPPPEKAKPGEPTPRACKLEPKVACPDGYYCRLVAENTGECVPIR